MSVILGSTGVTFPNGSTQTTAATGSGTVSSVAAGTGLSGGTITTSGTISLPLTYTAVGSYIIAQDNGASTGAPGSTIAGAGMVASCFYGTSASNPYSCSTWYTTQIQTYNVALPGTWQRMGFTTGTYYTSTLFIRIA